MWWQETVFEDDIKRLGRLARHVEKGGFPFAAFATYARSLERFNEIRRTVRPNKIIRPQEARLIVRQLSGGHRRREGGG